MVSLRTASRVLIAWSIEPTRGRVHENLFVFILIFICVCRSILYKRIRIWLVNYLKKCLVLPFGVDISLVVLFLVLEVLQAQVHLLVVELVLFHLFSPHGALFHLLGVTKSSFPSRFGVDRRWLCAGSWFYCGSIFFNDKDYIIYYIAFLNDSF